jgi:hypothetical protein
MRHVDGIYTQRFNRRHHRDGSLFRGRYKAILIDADEYLSALVRYIHLNPVQAGAVKQPEDYRWGSHRFYLEAKGAPTWLNTAEVLGQMGGRKAFHEFVLSGNEESLERYYKAERQNPILGSQTFIDRVRQPAAMLAREHPRYQRQALQTDPDRVYHMKRDDIFRGVRGQENEARKVAMYLVKRCCDRTLPEIAGHFGIASYATVSWNCRTIGLRIAKNKKFRDRIERITASISQHQT